MSKDLAQFLALYSVGSAIRSQQLSNLADFNQDMLNMLLTLEEDESCARPGGSLPGKSPNLPRDPVAGHARLMEDYFNNNPVYGEALFCCCFCMSRNLFVHIMKALGQDDVYFTQRSDCTMKAGNSPHQKVTAAIRQLAYGTIADHMDKYLRIAENTAIQCLLKFCSGIIRIFGPTYQRKPNTEDTQRILAENTEQGFPGMLGSLDCMHWTWKNCPKALQGHFSGRLGKPSLILEVVATCDLWIWHTFFGLPGTNNDINVLKQSNLFRDLSQGIAPPSNFKVNGKEYETRYYLADGIYPKWGTLIQTFSAPSTPKLKHFAKCQEAARKDVERMFGVLQACFHIVCGAARMWQPSSLCLIMNACIILHNMIIEDQGNPGYEYLEEEDLVPPPPLPRPTGVAAQFMRG